MMERFHEELAEGRRNLRTADHIISVTHPLVKDNRLLLTAAENIFLAAKKLMAALLHYEEAFKRIPHFKEDYDSMLYWFRSKCMPIYKLSSEYRKLIEELKSLFDDHKASSVEFSRKDSFVICSDAYNVRKVTLADLKLYVSIIKRMLIDIEGVVLRYEGVFGRIQGRAKAR